MTDVLTEDQRALNMSRIRGKNTKPEMMIRRGLHARGLRYRLHRKDLPGCPDLVFPARKAVIFVNGCFWHGHECSLFKWPATRIQFWRAKIARNKERDRKVQTDLQSLGWRVLVIWECALKGRKKRTVSDVLGQTEAFLNLSESTFSEIEAITAKSEAAVGSIAQAPNP